MVIIVVAYTSQFALGVFVTPHSWLNPFVLLESLAFVVEPCSSGFACYIVTCLCKCSPSRLNHVLALFAFVVRTPVARLRG